MNIPPIAGLGAFQKILELTKPINESNELWLKLGHNQFIVGSYTPDGHFPIWETKLTDSDDSKSRVRTLYHDDCWEYVSNWAKHNDGGVFFVSTQPQGFPLKEAIATSDDIAAELDEGTPEEQLELISEFVTISGLKPAYIVHSGSKSYHPHWKATGHLPIEQTIYLRQLVCIALNSDPAISNPHQPMRIAGFYRKEKDREQTLEYWSESRYTYDQLLTGIKNYFIAKDIPFPESMSEDRWRIYKRGRRDNNLDLSILVKPESELYPLPDSATTPTFTSVCTDSIPLHLALSKAHQDILGGVASERNNTGFNLALDLIGCRDWLISKGYSVEGDPHNIFINYCQSCSPGNGWNPREWNSIWRSANRNSPTPARRDLTNFVHWYRWDIDPEYRAASIKQWKTENDLLLISEPDPVAYQEYCTRLEEEEKIEEAIAKSEFLQMLENQAKGLAKKYHKGFGQYLKYNKSIKLPKFINFNPNTPLPTPQDYQNQEPPRIRFKKGQRHQVIIKLNQLGWQFILDRSFMGFGKSHDMGNFVNSQGKTWYLDLNHRNPSVSTVEKNFSDLSVRHNGLNYDELRTTPSGQPYQVWATEDDDNPDIKSLCHNAHVFIKFHKKNYPIDSLRDFEDNSLNPICKGCRFQHWKVDDEKGEKIAICAAQRGDGYGFRYARKMGLAQSQIRASINSIPSLEEYDYSNDIAIVEEASTIVTGTKTVIANFQDFSTKFLQLLEEYPDLFKLLSPIRKKLFPILSGEEKIGNYGLNHAEILELLGEPNPESDIEDILQQLILANPNFDDVYVKAAKHRGWGKNWRGSQSTANWFESVQARKATLENINNLPSNFLMDLLCVWYGLSWGAIRLDYRGLKITTNDPNHGEKLRAMKQVILLDATGNKRQLAKRIDIDNNSIIEIQQEMPELSNLTVVNLEMPGLGGNQYSDTALARLVALQNKLKERHGQDTPILGLKKYWKALDLDGNWFNDNRGSNRFKAQTAIAALGTPRINLGVAEDEYLTLYGSLEGFEDYYQSLIEAEITQLIGRPRAHLYPDTEFIIYIVGTNQNLDYLKQYGINVVNRHAFEVTPEAGTKNQFAKWKLLRALHSLKQAGKKITQQNLAQAASISQSYLNEIVKTWSGGWRAFKKLSSLLINNYRGSDKIWETFDLKTEAIIKEWLGLKPIGVLEDLAQIIINEDWEAYKVYAECYSGDILSTAWGILARLIFPQEVIENFEQILASPLS
ncbi:MAG: hypothetical protein QNJ60_00440 [Xenococcaceae cyanobacterium MO_188.B19]|nr:hypothetical protein [Xenococcaceae cyanobacterium MO_188.B19]